MEAAASDSALVLIRTDQDKDELHDLLSRSERTVGEVEALLTKCKACGLSKSRERNGKKIRLENAEVGRLSSRLQEHGDELLSYLAKAGLARTLTGLVQTHLHALPEQIQQSVDAYAAQVRAGQKHGSIMTAYEGDDRHFWRRIRRELFGDGFPSQHLHKYKPQIKKYLESLAKSGWLSEDEVSGSEDLAPIRIVELDVSKIVASSDVPQALGGRTPADDDLQSRGPGSLDFQAIDVHPNHDEHVCDVSRRKLRYLSPYCESADEDASETRPGDPPLQADGPLLQLIEPESSSQYSRIGMADFKGHEHSAKYTAARGRTATSSGIARSHRPLKDTNSDGNRLKHQSLVHEAASTPSFGSTGVSSDSDDINVRRSRMPRTAGYRGALCALGYPFLVEAKHYLGLIALSRRQREGLAEWYERYWQVMDQKKTVQRDTDHDGDSNKPWRWITPQDPHVDADTWQMELWRPAMSPQRAISPQRAGHSFILAHCGYEDDLSVDEHLTTSRLAHYGDQPRDHQERRPVVEDMEGIRLLWHDSYQAEESSTAGSTWISKDLIKVEALSDLGWAFVEDDRYFLLDQALDDCQIDRLFDVSVQYNDKGFKVRPLRYPSVPQAQPLKRHSGWILIVHDAESSL